MLERMELRHLRYFVAVAEEENVSRTASKLRVSQPGVSRQIHDLEDEIGFPLFATHRQVRAPDGGRESFLYRSARHPRAHRYGCERSPRQLCIPSRNQRRLRAAGNGGKSCPALCALSDTDFPGCRSPCTICPEEMLPLLLQKKLDVALTLLPHKLPRKLNMKLLERYEPRVVVGMTHPLAKAKSISLDQISSEPFAALARKDYPYYYQHLRRMFATVARKPRISSEHDSGTSLMAVVAAGHEFTLLPCSVSSATGRRLKTLRVRPALPPWSYVALCRKDAATEPVKAFVSASQPSRETKARTTEHRQRSVLA